ncbi:MAG: DUF6318 family protein [Dermatophilaceae bacterium]
MSRYAAATAPFLAAAIALSLTACGDAAAQPVTVSATLAGPATTGRSGAESAYALGKPTFPKAAGRDSVAGGATFARYYLDLLNYAFAKPASGLLGRLGTDGCVACHKYEELSADLVAKKHRYAGPIVLVDTVTAVAGDSAGGNSAGGDSAGGDSADRVVVTVGGRQPGTSVVDAKGLEVATSDDVAVTLKIELVWVSNHWRVDRITIS